jgi:catechol 2,3-dioxygenase-like lactoylglutathione lyase family enzyme
MKNVFLILFLLAAVPAYAQSSDMAAAPAALTTRGAFFALSVPDVDASAKWYADTLGLKVVKQFPKDQYSQGVKILAGGNLIVELVQLEEALPLSRMTPTRTKPEQLHGIFKVGVIVDDLDQILDMLKARHVPIFSGPSPARSQDMRGAQIKDNAGNIIQFLGRK